ncbi:MAG: divergent PAP2 family protein [Candidatus Margulisiibacteriota bacterium]
MINIIDTFYPLIASILAMLASQFIKLILMLLSNKRFDFSTLTRSGGMPSSHSAMITAVSLSIGLKDGFDSSYFFLSVILSFIVIYDARGIRHTVGEHAKFLNKTILSDSPNRLNEYVGHNLPEIIVGISIGLIMSFGMYHLINF